MKYIKDYINKPYGIIVRSEEDQTVFNEMLQELFKTSSLHCKSPIGKSNDCKKGAIFTISSRSVEWMPNTEYGRDYFRKHPHNLIFREFSEFSPNKFNNYEIY